MKPQGSKIQLFKIIVGIAWIDGKIQTEEQDYLSRLAQQQGLEKHPDIYPLLHGLKKVTRSECYEWIHEYLGADFTPETLNQLIEDVSGLVYSDGNIDTAEAEILAKIQGMVPHSSSLSKSLNSKIVHKLKGYYKHFASL